MIFEADHRYFFSFSFAFIISAYFVPWSRSITWLKDNIYNKDLKTNWMEYLALMYVEYYSDKIYFIHFLLPFCPVRIFHFMKQVVSKNTEIR